MRFVVRCEESIKDTPWKVIRQETGKPDVHMSAFTNRASALDWATQLQLTVEPRAVQIRESYHRKIEALKAIVRAELDGDEEKHHAAP